ncbi:MAG: AMIN domain-containing protein [Helicobacteraceae bacterium]|jgi:hypothetical protein|nr:AMIN domain-containing protein [Helicobacteraceae bacterium]
MRLVTVLFLTIPLIMTARDNPFVPAANNETAVVKETVGVPSKPIQKPKGHLPRPTVAPVTNVQAETNLTLNTQPLEENPLLRTQAETKPKIHPQRNSYKKEVVNYGNVRFVIRENSAYIETKDTVIKHFSIPNPPSIVIDFSAPSDFSSKRKVLTVKPFVKLEMGAHKDRYRVVLRLNDMHKYKVETKKYGQVITIIN